MVYDIHKRFGDLNLFFATPFKAVATFKKKIKRYG